MITTYWILFPLQFNSLFLASRLVDIEPYPMLPTWRNSLVGVNGITKWLDRFLLEDYLLISFQKYKSCVGWETILDHQPIWL